MSTSPDAAAALCGDELLAADAWLGRCDEQALAAGERVFRGAPLGDALARLRGVGGRAAAVADLIDLYEQLSTALDALAAASDLSSAELRTTLEKVTFTSSHDPDLQVVEMAQALAELLELLAGRCRVADLPRWAGDVAAALRDGPGPDGRLVTAALLEA